ncbi:unnamed protein product [Brassicogethes aeneus]|uniref:Uncharacterized protein n=1 Tax=Brassicogethes aeneus TaxID=1431903 RepID=A0A9P0AK77_BRAAE|nr:unnamed protein product [Brassicogethes aeneus]
MGRAVVMCCKSRGALSRLGLIWGLFALAALSIAFLSGSWLYTREPVTLPNSRVATSISFRIGLWRVCPSVKRVNSSTRGYSKVQYITLAQTIKAVPNCYITEDASVARRETKLRTYTNYNCTNLKSNNDDVEAVTRRIKSSLPAKWRFTDPVINVICCVHNFGQINYSS